MSVDPVVSAMLLGFVLGLQHATDPDHLVAVATIITRERRFRAGALIGLLWGLGHAATLTVAGGALVLLNMEVGPASGSWLELGVAAMIVILGLLRLRDVLGGLGAAAPEHLLANHDHDGREAFHSHPHAHDARVHAHPHIHPSRRLLSVLGGKPGGSGGRAVLVGAVHGLAGTAAVSLLVLTTLRSPLAALLYLLVFGLGTIVGMTVLAAALAYPVSLALRFRYLHRALGFCSGLGAIAFGLIYAVRAV